MTANFERMKHRVQNDPQYIYSSIRVTPRSRRYGDITTAYIRRL